MGDWELTEESFNLFLSWLDPNRDAAGKKYEAIRRRLIVMFDSRGCLRSEELADEAINRFIRRLPAIIESFTGDPIPYIHTIAHRLHLEYVEKQSLPLLEDHLELQQEKANNEEEQAYECLERCLEKLTSKNRELVIDYYQQEKQDKIDFRKSLAERMGLAVNALRTKMHRIRSTLHECINHCLEQNNDM